MIWKNYDIVSSSTPVLTAGVYSFFLKTYGRYFLSVHKHFLMVFMPCDSVIPNPDQIHWTHLLFILIREQHFINIKQRTH